VISTVKEHGTRDLWGCWVVGLSGFCEAIHFEAQSKVALMSPQLDIDPLSGSQPQPNTIKNIPKHSQTLCWFFMAIFLNIQLPGAQIQRHLVN